MPLGPFLREYGVEAKFNFVLFEVDGVDFRVDAAAATGDSILMKDEGAEANTDNLFIDEGNGYSITLTGTEMTFARGVIYLIDSATKAWLDDSVIIETYGSASAMHQFPLGTATVTVGANNDKADYLLAAGSLTAGVMGAAAISSGVFDANAITAGVVADDVIVVVSAGTIVNVANMATGVLSAGAFPVNAMSVGVFTDGFIDAGAFAANAITASAVAATTIDLIWDETIAGHTTDGSFGDVINDMVATASGTYRFIASALALAPSGGESAQTIVDGVWNEIITNHTVDGSFGDMWNDMVATAGGTYAYIASALAAAPSGGESAATIVNGVWDELRAGHTTAGSFGIDLSILSAASIIAVSAGTNIIVANMNAGVISAGAYAANAITGSALIAGIIDSTKFAVDAITGSALADGTIMSGKFGANALTAGVAADDFVVAVSAGTNVIVANMATGVLSAGAFAANAISGGVITDDTVIAVSAGTNVIVANMATGVLSAGAFAANAISGGVITDDTVIAVSAGTNVIVANMAAGVLSAGVYAASALGATAFAAGAISNDVLADGAIASDTFAGSAITASAVAAGTIDIIWDEVVDGTVTARESLVIANTLLAAKVSGGSSTTATFRDLADDKDRIVIVFTEDGDKTALTLSDLT